MVMGDVKQTFGIELSKGLVMKYLVKLRFTTYTVVNIKEKDWLFVLVGHGDCMKS